MKKGLPNGNTNNRHQDDSPRRVRNTKDTADDRFRNRGMGGYRKDAGDTNRRGQTIYRKELSSDRKPYRNNGRNEHWWEDDPYDNATAGDSNLRIIGKLMESLLYNKN